MADTITTTPADTTSTNTAHRGGHGRGRGRGRGGRPGRPEYHEVSTSPDVVSDALGSMIASISHGHNAQIKILEEKIKHLEERLNSKGSNHEEVNGRIDDLEARMTAKFVSAAMNVNEMFKQVDANCTKLRLSDLGAYISEFDDVKKRIKTLENNFSEFDDVKKHIKTLEDNFSRLYIKVTELTYLCKAMAEIAMYKQ
jgi:chaperonin cofactor prefoldin